MRRFLVPLLAGALALPATGAAQATIVEPVLQVGFVGDLRPALTAGGRWTYTPPPNAAQADETGITVVPAASWSLQLLASAGVTFARPRDRAVDFTALGSAALLFPRGSGTVRGWGPALLGSFRPDAAGPGVRVETSFAALGLQAGVLWPLEGGNPLAALTVDVSESLLRDLRRR